MFYELRYTLRTLKNNASFTAIAVLTLALGIGANTAMFGVVNGVLLRPLDYPNASRIVQLKTSFLQEGRSIPRLTGPDFVDVRSGASAVEQMSFYWGGEMGVQLADHAEFVGTYFVTPKLALGYSRLLSIGCPDPCWRSHQGKTGNRSHESDPSLWATCRLRDD